MSSKERSDKDARTWKYGSSLSISRALTPFVAAFDVAKDEETRSAISTWDYTKTEALMAEREAKIRKKLEERIRTAADREALARMLITKELCEKVEKGDAEGIKEQLIEIAEEAEKTNRRPITTCEARNKHGQTLISIACQHGRKEVRRGGGAEDEG